MNSEDYRFIESSEVRLREDVVLETRSFSSNSPIIGNIRLALLGKTKLGNMSQYNVTV